MGRLQSLKKIVLDFKRARTQNKFKGGCYPLCLPLGLEAGQLWKPYPIFSGGTVGLQDIACHASALVGGFSPHPPHEHEEEEILIVLSGEVDIIIKDPQRTGQFVSKRLRENQFAYYPARFAHSLQTVSQASANYLMFKWRGTASSQGDLLDHGVFDALPAHNSANAGRGFRPAVVFEAGTRYLKKLQCHTTVLEPKAGYPPHTDPYDVAILVLDGEVETLGRCIKSPAVIFYPAGQAHGMLNPAKAPAKYIVFEFWTAQFLKCYG